MEKRLYTIISLDENHIEDFEIYEDIDKAKKSFKKHLRERGIGILKQRKHLREEFYRDGEWQMQFIKTRVT